MAFTLNAYKCGGVIYRIDETEFTKKSNWPKRAFYVEVPSSSSGMQKTEVFKFLVMGDEAGSLDFYNEGEWVEVLFKIEGRWWKPPNEDKEIYLGSLRPIDIHKGENPFEKGVDKVSQDINDLSSDLMNELAKNVKDYASGNKQPELFDKDDPANDLPF